MIQPLEPEQFANHFPGTKLTIHRPIAVEANLLRFPLFGLQTRGLRSLEGFECRGRITRRGQAREFVFRTARSTATMYPGPLARSAHLAFLSLVTDQGLPIQNPIQWGWRDLCRRIGSSPSGRAVQRLKRAIEATAGLTIFSEDALYSKPDGKPLQTRQVSHIYDRVAFINDPLPDGGVADTNYLWFSPWYLDNLNALFTAPLDHDLWRYLDKRSAIASRLYELLLINFFGGIPQFRINYTKLAQLLPVRPERFLSDAQRQFESAFRLIEEVGIVRQINWKEGKMDVAQVHFDRGHRLDRMPPRNLSATQTEPAELLAVTEIRQPAERELVSEFYRLWQGSVPQHLRPAEFELARTLISRYGRTRVRGAMPLLIEHLTKHWPAAKTFIAVESYIEEVIGRYDQQQRAAKDKDHRRRQWRADEVEFARQREEQRQFESEWLPIWNQISPDEQESIRSKVLTAHPMLKHGPGFLLSRCLRELAKRHKGGNSSVPKVSAA